MQLIDTHVHLYAKDYKDDLKEVIARAQKAGIEYFFMPNINQESITPMLEIVGQYPQNCFAMLGLHPSDIKADAMQVLDDLEKRLETHPWIALGEIGIDLYHDTTFLKEQEAALQRQLQWAQKYDLPVVFHVRKGLQEVLQILKKFEPFRFRGIFHCFSGSLEEVRQIQKQGDFKFGIGGIVTFKNAHLAQIIPQIGLENIVLETDGPFLAPHPFRGKRNEPAYIAEVVAVLSDILGVSPSLIAQKTNENIKQIFKTLPLFL